MDISSGALFLPALAVWPQGEAPEAAAQSAARGSRQLPFWRERSREPRRLAPAPLCPSRPCPLPLPMMQTRPCWPPALPTRT
jgi:hypothetical protein